MKKSEMKDLSADELRTKATELKDQLFKLRFQKAIGQLDNPMKIKNIRKTMARIATFLNNEQKRTE
jgi:large subunit ribosomal protein L29